MSGIYKGKALALTLALAVTGGLSEAGAATFLVNSFTDDVDVQPGNGQCATATGACTLRAAVQEANALAGPDTIELQAGTYLLGVTGADEDAGATGDLDVLDALTVMGAGSAVTLIDGNGDRVFHTGPDVSLALHGLTVQNGVVTGNGGGVLASGSLEAVDLLVRFNTAGAQGGGLHVTGTLRLTDTVLDENTASDGGGLYLAAGGATLENTTFTNNVADQGAGLYALGTLNAYRSNFTENVADLRGGGAYLAAAAELEQVVLSGNKALDAGGGVYGAPGAGAISLRSARVGGNRLTGTVAAGAGLHLASGTRLQLAEVAITGNAFERPSTEGSYRGGGTYFAGDTLQGENVTWSANEADVGGGLEVVSGSATLRYSTLANNAALTGGNLAASGTGTVSLQAVLLAEPAAGENCSGTITSLGYNIDTGTSCMLNATGDKSATPAGIGELDPETGTHALLSGSAAIDAGVPDDCPVLDGAGFVRADGACDVGAREWDGLPAEGGTLHFEMAASDVGESDQSVAITVIRDGGNVPVRVAYRAIAETATLGSDFLPAEGELAWAENETGPKTFTLSVVGNTDHEPTETLRIVLENARGGATLVAPYSHTVTLVDDDEELPPPGEEPLPPPSDEPPPEECIAPDGNPHCGPPPGQIDNTHSKAGGGSMDLLWGLALVLVLARRARQA